MQSKLHLFHPGVPPNICSCLFIVTYAASRFLVMDYPALPYLPLAMPFACHHARLDTIYVHSGKCTKKSGSIELGCHTVSNDAKLKAGAPNSKSSEPPPTPPLKRRGPSSASPKAGVVVERQPVPKRYRRHIRRDGG